MSTLFLLLLEEIVHHGITLYNHSFASFFHAIAYYSKSFATSIHEGTTCPFSMSRSRLPPGHDVEYHGFVHRMQLITQQYAFGI